MPLISREILERGAIDIVRDNANVRVDADLEADRGACFASLVDALDVGQGAKRVDDAFRFR